MSDRRPDLDLHYTDPRLARLYDVTCGWGEDRDFYLARAARPAMRVLDLGCGTGLLCTAFAARGHAVTGLDPSGRMLAVARGRPGGSAVRWIEAFAQDFSLDTRFDLVTMTGHAFQTLLRDDDVAALFERVRRHLAPGGTFVFESRNPAIEWRSEWDGHESVHGAGDERFRYSIRVRGETDETLSFEQRYALGDGTLTSSSTLRFMPRERIVALLDAAGLRIVRLSGDWRGAPFAPGRSREMIHEVAAHGSRPARQGSPG